MLEIFYENPASPFYMQILIFFSVIVALIWRKIVLKKVTSPKKIEPSLPSQQSTVLSIQPVIMTFMDIYNLLS